MALVTRRRQAQMDAAESCMVEERTPSTQASPRKDQKLAMRGKDEGGGQMAATEVTKSSMTIFDDDDEMSKPVVITETLTKAPASAEKDEEEDESDDEAPETVSTAKAATEIKKAATATQKAAQEQAAAQKRKRQERDNLLKKQAEERRKVETLRPGSAGSQVHDDGDASLEDDESKNVAAVAARPVLAAGRRRGGQVDIPAVLPAEFLTDSSDESQGEEEKDRRASKPKRRKVAVVERQLTRLDKGPRDAMVGSTVYRVAQKVDKRMAPKASQHAKSTKELLLKRNRTPGRKPHGGFLCRR